MMLGDISISFIETSCHHILYFRQIYNFVGINSVNIFLFFFLSIYFPTQFDCSQWCRDWWQIICVFPLKLFQYAVLLLPLCGRCYSLMHGCYWPLRQKFYSLNFLVGGTGTMLSPGLIFPIIEVRPFYVLYPIFHELWNSSFWKWEQAVFPTLCKC